MKKFLLMLLTLAGITVSMGFAPPDTAAVFKIDDSSVITAKLISSLKDCDENVVNPEDFWIDLETETLRLGYYISGEYSATVASMEYGDRFNLAAYSLDGGNKWYEGDKISDPLSFSRMLDKGMKLVITDNYNTSTKRPVVGMSNIIEFPIITKRPNANPEKTKPVFWLSDTHDVWWLVPKNSTEPAENYMFASDETSAKKLPENPNWWNCQLAAALDPLVNGQKAAKITLYIKVPATVSSITGKNVPASKIWKMNWPQLSKPPKYKIDYKNETIKLKAGTIFATGTSLPDNMVNVPKDHIEHFDYTYLKNSSTVNLSEIISSGNNISFFVRTAASASGKKPGSMLQEIKIAPRASAPSDHGLTAKGMKITGSNLKKLEFSSDGKNWGKLPAITGSVTYQIRWKATAKKPGDNGKAAGVPGYISFTKVKDSDGKDTLEISYMTDAPN